MLIKNIFFQLFLINSSIIFIYFLFFSFISLFFLYTNLRNKLISFFLLIFVISIWGFLYSLDGVYFVLIITELSVFLILIISYIQIYCNLNYNYKKINKYFYIIFILPFFIFLNNFNFKLFYFSYYNFLDYISGTDFIILFNITYMQLPYIVIIIGLIISLFSLFFIILYFNLKSFNLKNKKNKKKISILRKQNLIKQGMFNSKLYTFQK